MGSIFVGVAQAALDLALDYAKQRVQGGVPIFQHQNVKMRLSEMFRKVQAARALSRQVTLYNSMNIPPRTQRARREYVEPVNCSPLCFSSFPQSSSGIHPPPTGCPARGLRA
jgi:alkylation response protein AidB-like acyl-CoA dehydrogenase